MMLFRQLLLAVLAFASAFGVPGQALADRRAERIAILKEAVELRRGNQHKRAAELLSGWLEVDPGDAPTAFMLAEVYLALDSQQEAVEVWLELLGHHPPQELRYRQVATRCRQARLEDTAIDVLLDGRRHIGSEFLFARELGELYLAKGRYDEAVHNFLGCRAADDCEYGELESSMRSYVTGGAAATATISPKARALLASLEKAAAVETWRRHIVDIASLIATLALETGNSELGLESLSAVVAHPGGDRSLFQYATRCAAGSYHGTAAAAYQLYMRYGREESLRYQAALRSARSLIAIDRGQEAADILVDLVDAVPPTQPEGWEARVHLARLQLDVLDDRASAAQTLEPTLSVAPVQGSRDQWITAGRWLAAEIAMLDDDFALASELAQSLAVKTPEGPFMLAQLHYYRGDFERAAALLDSLTGAEPQADVANDALQLLVLIDEFRKDPRLIDLARAHLLERQGRSSEAATHWWHLWTEGSGLRRLSALTRARILEDANALEEALRWYDEVLEAFPKEEQFAARIGRARILERSGRQAQALREYESCLLLYPSDPMAPQLRLEVERLRQLGADDAG